MEAVDPACDEILNLDSDDSSSVGIVVTDNEEDEGNLSDYDLPLPEDPSLEVTTQLFAQTNVHDIPAFHYAQVSAEEREAALQELHGALDLVHETPEFLQSKLLDLEEVADPSYPFLDVNTKRQAYDQALKQNEAYVKELRLSFLRAEKFDVHKAVVRMFAHFEMRLALFDDETILGRDIQISDFSSETDNSILRQGSCQLLPSQDRVGRPIVFLQLPKSVQISPAEFHSKLKVFFWLSLLATRMGEHIQRKGFVTIWHGMNSGGKGNAGNGLKYFSLLDSMSTACTSAHAVYDNIDITKAVSAMFASQSNYAFRFRTHYGSNIACLNSLMAYGIPKEWLPVHFDGSLRMEDHNRFLEEQTRQAKTTESTQQTPAQAPTGGPTPNELTSSQAAAAADNNGDDGAMRYARPPTEMDIICGRGQRGNKNPGNILLKRLLEKNEERYNKSSRQGKTMVSHEIYTAMRQAGCRFLMPAEEPKSSVNRSYMPELWKEVDDKMARDRIGHRFRNMRKAASASRQIR
mmetsp:Transcript_93769/g.270945  ORF Transcript_93769/g.270945 Transcript_93769/m.270945 type:complete len:520 (-) Transcript_93769:8-1567(-)